MMVTPQIEGSKQIARIVGNSEFATTASLAVTSVGGRCEQKTSDLDPRDVARGCDDVKQVAPNRVKQVRTVHDFTPLPRSARTS